MTPPFLLFLVVFMFPVFLVLRFGGFPISLFFFDFSIFSLVRFCSFHFPQIPIMLIEKKEGTPIRPRPRGRGVPKLGGVEVPRDSRSVQPDFRRSL